jgi:hypothetical protein
MLVPLRLTPNGRGSDRTDAIVVQYLLFAINKVCVFLWILQHSPVEPEDCRKERLRLAYTLFLCPMSGQAQYGCPRA